MNLLANRIHRTKLPPGKFWAVPVAGALLIALLGQPVAAIEQDLVDVSGNAWVPLEEFTVFKVNPLGWEKPENYTGDDQKTVEASQDETTATPATESQPVVEPGQPVINPLGRSLNLPVMPGFNQNAVSDEEPFEFNAGRWVSMERYADKARRFAAEPSQDAESVTATETPAADDPAPKAMAEPSRPLNLPVMPGMGQDYEIKVSSTEDEDAEGVLAQPNRPLNLPVMPGLGQSTPVQGSESSDAGSQLADLAARPELQLAGSLWQDAKAIAALQNGDEEGLDNKRVPLHVRLARLPDARITPIPEDSAKKPQPAPPQKAAAKPKRNPEVCAALSAYKKQQLAAIESDRQTLNALQAAIADLGLDKKLDFMQGASGSLAPPPRNIGGQAESGQVLPGNSAPGSPVDGVAKN